MKKFKFLFLIVLVATMFIGCAQPTADTIVPETTTEDEDSEVSDAQLIEAICANFKESATY